MKLSVVFVSLVLGAGVVTLALAATTKKQPRSSTITLYCDTNGNLVTKVTKAP